MTLNESDITDPLKAAAGKVVTKTLSKIIKTIRNSNLSKYSKVRPVKEVRLVLILYWEKIQVLVILVVK